MVARGMFASVWKTLYSCGGCHSNAGEKDMAKIFDQKDVEHAIQAIVDQLQHLHSSPPNLDKELVREAMRQLAEREFKVKIPADMPDMPDLGDPSFDPPKD